MLFFFNCRPQIIRYHGYARGGIPRGYRRWLHTSPCPGYQQDARKFTEMVQRPVVFLQHGLLCSLFQLGHKFAKRKLCFHFGRSRIDVGWGMFAANTYGLHHLKYPVDSDQFWEFSWDEMARYDLPAMLKFVLSKTSQPSLFYVGHSQGTH
ncbi:hypothetical protein OS493_001026 [Desmophyllum pertusum]|uniref:Triacylglycerol lipase n=1 Tax=Desmophyllum pertusum TaxID=174260 RepID=A0A9X0D5X0_9CNID|nr:hypothetical protein OS493_001026 [Desmophyllum pertusum]